MSWEAYDRMYEEHQRDRELLQKLEEDIEELKEEIEFLDEEIKTFKETHDLSLIEFMKKLNELSLKRRVKMEKLFELQDYLEGEY